MAESIVLAKAIKFALRIVALYKYLTEQKREFLISKQILLSGSLIAKHVRAGIPNLRTALLGTVHRPAEGARDRIVAAAT